METPAADPAAPPLERPPYIQCTGCYGRGFIRVRIEAESRLLSKDPSQTHILREHDACNGAGIMILRTPRNGAEPYYGSPKLR